MITWANSLTASRFIFFAVCIGALALDRPKVAVVFFLLAWGLDAIDGPIARYLGQESVFGSQLDKAVDRIVLAGTAVALIRFQYIPPAAIFLFVKDIGLHPVLTMRRKGDAFVSSGWKGKLTSVMQGMGILWLFAGMPGQSFVILFVALFGGYTAVDHLRKV